jgi:hypothetical protein
VVETERDVIGLPIEGDLDINGWDLKKALALLIKPNPVLLEWLRSPIVYRADADAMARLAALGEQTAYLRPSRYHYLRLAEPQYRRYVAGRDTVRLKKYLYVVRPVLALRWLRLHPDHPVPMHLAALRAGGDRGGPAGPLRCLPPPLQPRAAARGARPAAADAGPRRGSLV